MDDRRLDDIAEGIREIRGDVKEMRAELAELKAWNRIFKLGISALSAVVLTVFGAYIEWKFNQLN